MISGKVIYKNFWAKSGFQTLFTNNKQWNAKERFFCLQLFSNLLAGGFSIEQALSFMEKFSTSSAYFSKVLTEEFRQGGSFSSSFHTLKYAQSILSQIEFGEIHGKTQEVLQQILKQQVALKKQKENLLKVASYPILLLCFLFGICIVMKNFLLPQMSQQIEMKENIAIEIVNVLPTVFASAIIVILGGGIVGKIAFRKVSAMKKVAFCMKVPLLSTFYRKWLTINLAREWGRLFETGLEMREVLEICKKMNYSTFFSELSSQMEEELRGGVSLIEQVERFSFVEKTLKVMIISGDVKASLGSELLFYSELIWEEFLTKMEKKMTYIQPIVFLFIAGMIIGLYSAFLLPLYETMGGLF